MAVQQPAGGKKKPQGNATQFTLDMDIKGLSLILTLMALTMVVVFYLGIIYGKAMRNPSDLDLSPGLSKGSIVPPKNLKIYDVRQTNDELRALQSDFETASKKSDRLQKAEDLLHTNEVKRKSKEANTQKSLSAFQVDDLEKTRTNANEESRVEPALEAPKKNDEAPTVNWPQQVLSDTPAKSNETLYSVQVMATRSKDKAATIIRQLALKRFEAYMVKGKVGNTTIYRVRVGKNNKVKIRKIKKRLKGTVKGLGSKLPIIQIN